MFFLFVLWVGRVYGVGFFVLLFFVFFVFFIYFFVGGGCNMIVISSISCNLPN